MNIDKLTLTTLFIVLAFLSSGWKTSSAHASCNGGESNGGEEVLFQATVVDSESGQVLPARVHLKDAQGKRYLVQSKGGQAVHYERDLAHLPRSPEVHTTLSAHPFFVRLLPGRYFLRVERGKEYLPFETVVDIGDQSQERTIRLRRWINMSSRGWYSGDTHVHRSLSELPNVMLAEDLNVALPLSYWVRDSTKSPAEAVENGDRAFPQKIFVDPQHVIHTRNTEYEIFQVDGQRQTLGAVFVLNHRKPLPLKAPPVGPLAELARREGAILDLDKHSWPWSLMLVPVMNVDLFELSNNHVWQTEFGFKDWTIDTIGSHMNLQQDEKGLTEWGWIDYGFQTYYTLVNCGFRMRVTAGTASGVHPVQLGFGRVYVRLPDGFSYEKWIQGLNAGNSFVTTGPMMDLRFNNKDAGQHFQFTRSQTARVHISGTIESRRPLRVIEIIVNGEVSEVIEPENTATTGDGFRTDLDIPVSRDESFWVAVRCFEDHPTGRVRFAHTNPVYLDREGSSIQPRKRELQYLLHRLDTELERLKGVLGKEALAEFEKARQIYERIESEVK